MYSMWFLRSKIKKRSGVIYVYWHDLRVHSGLFSYSFSSVAAWPDQMEKVEGGYEPIERIGEGGFSAVYKCCNSVTKKIVAVKRIFFVDENKGVPSSVIREISLLKELDHHNVIRWCL